MDAAWDNDAFWAGDECFIAVNPHRVHDADGLAEFAAVSGATRSLLFFQTSGSEGAPKWVGLSREAFLASARAVNAHLGSTAQDRWLIALPLHHVGGFAILARCHASGAAFVQMEGKWSAERFVKVCREQRITLASLVPAQVYDLVKAELKPPDSLRAVVVGGGALPSTENFGLRARALGWPVLQSYGMTEACSQIATEPLDHLRTGFNPEALEVLPHWNLVTDKNGNLFIRGPALASGYASRRDRRGWQWERITPESGLVTRDQVELWSDRGRRWLRFVGRGASFVKVLGELVNLSALQSRLESLAIADGQDFNAVVILPLADDRKGSRLVLVGSLPKEQMESLRRGFNERSLGCERLDESRAVSALPRSALGKLDLGALKTMLGIA